MAQSQWTLYRTTRIACKRRRLLERLIIMTHSLGVIERTYSWRDSKAQSQLTYARICSSKPPPHVLACKRRPSGFLLEFFF